MAVSTLNGVIRSTRKNFTFGAKSAGQSGYDSVTMDPNGITNSYAQIVSMRVDNGYLDATKGLQFTPMAYDATTRDLYYSYYAPQATQAVTMSIELWYK